MSCVLAMTRADGSLSNASEGLKAVYTYAFAKIRLADRRLPDEKMFPHIFAPQISTEHRRE